MTFAIIETVKAPEHPDDILSTLGLDAINIGPFDLSLALDCTPTFDDVDPKAAEATKQFVEQFVEQCDEQCDEQINALGADHIDAPVSSDEVGAKAAALTVIFGGGPGPHAPGADGRFRRQPGAQST